MIRDVLAGGDAMVHVLYLLQGHWFATRVLPIGSDHFDDDDDVMKQCCYTDVGWSNTLSDQ
eukprot:NODE_1817_length_487_cov_83.182648_g1739_i0.p3 GENE.NODE_1817_length_487_cov_83.182648_g1739_i0~~NODE_1817_length_487_cov_83.182648_g1739_i0.p3  ORF type:complete len:61 (-),score=12.98 NODE_1817_length_487_cov_83.182648_g1739_i0:173-355(-)